MRYSGSWGLGPACGGLLLLIAACGGGSGARGSGDPDGGRDAMPEDGGPDAPGGGDGGGGSGGGNGGDDSGSSGGGACEETSCGSGQVCEISGADAVCVGSCEGVQCAAGRVCEVEGNVGRCVVACDPACDEGQRCEVDEDGEGTCVDNTCSDLDCGQTEACVAASAAGGFVCVDNTCSNDVACGVEAHCSEDGICVADVCKPGTRRCEGDVVKECTANGAGEIDRVTCAGVEGFDSECSEASGQGGCSCRGDWDCPAHTACVLGRCEGTGREPTCFLPSLPFQDVLPTAEAGFPWGGHDADGYSGGDAEYTSDPPSRWAWGSPFPQHAQVSASPVVANLDDDNGDGLINELDFPEIIFTSFCAQNYFDNGVLRALHGGGDAAGAHLFAVCEDKLWREGDPVFDGDTGELVPEASCGCDSGALEPTGGVGVGDVDADGIPEILVLGDGDNGRLYVYNNRGELISNNDTPAIDGTDPAVTIANLDGAGMAEVIAGRTVFVLGLDDDQKLVVAHTLQGAGSAGVNNGQGAVSCAADLDGDDRMEVVAGGTAYRLPAAPAGDCPADTSGLDGDARLYCDGELDVLWQNGGTEGFCAIADVLGAPPAEGDPELPPAPDHPLDGAPEVLLISDGHLFVYDGLTGVERLDVTLDDRDGGPPNVDDFDGDGFPEVATAFDTKYVVHDFQAPTDDGAPAGACPSWPNVLDGDPDSTDPHGEMAGNLPRTPPAMGCVTDDDCGGAPFTCGSDGSCVCLHNGWASTTQDASSRVTGSSVFDFNGDGKAEVVYNDECYFRIYDGTAGGVYQRLKSQSPTRIEYPVVADVDNDGNAEVVFSSSNARSESCPDEGLGDYGNGINVIGEPEDRWVSARRMWNQHAYHVTNVLEGGGIPALEPDSWRAYNGRSYNTYRSNLPPIGNVAPDLVVTGVQVSSPDVACGEPLSDTIRITARILNQGDLRVGPGVVVRFQGDGETLGDQVLDTSLEPGAELFASLDHEAASAAALPDEVRVAVDATGDPDFGRERECHEDNNAASADVEAGETTPDLRLTVETLDEDCPDRGVRLVVYNDGSREVGDVVVRVYAGNPSAGGEPLGEDIDVGSLAAGGNSGNFDTHITLPARPVTLFFVVDPDDEVAECDDANNADSTSVTCGAELI